MAAKQLPLSARRALIAFSDCCAGVRAGVVLLVDVPIALMLAVVLADVVSRRLRFAASKRASSASASGTANESNDEAGHARDEVTPSQRSSRGERHSPADAEPAADVDRVELAERSARAARDDDRADFDSTA